MTHVPPLALPGDDPFPVPSPWRPSPRRAELPAPLPEAPKSRDPGASCPLPPPSQGPRRRWRPRQPHLLRSRSRAAAALTAAAMFVPPESIPGAASARDPGSSRGGAIGCRPARRRAASTTTPGLILRYCPLSPRGAPAHSLPAGQGLGLGGGAKEDTPLTGARPAVPGVKGARCCANGRAHHPAVPGTGAPLGP